MSSKKIRATLPAGEVAFLLFYQREHDLASFSAVVQAAVEALKNQAMREAYREMGEAHRAGLEIYPPNNTDGLLLP